MYSHHFGLTQDPFSIAPDPRYLFMSERHREALAHLLFGVAGRDGASGGTGGGFVLLTGDIGTGKTTICRCFLEQIPTGCHVAYIFNPKLTVIELLQSICEEFHVAVRPAVPSLATAKDYIDALNVFLLRSHAAGQSSVLIIDEAQNLHPDVLEQLRLLTNLETNERKLLQIVLIGQPELRDMLARPELEQLAQRVIARFHLDALTSPESTQYIQHRLAVAGHSGELPFDRKALRRIHQLARGIPRRLNLLCARSLLGAWANGLHRADRPVVDKAALEVFGAEIKRPSGPGQRTTAYALGALSLLAATVLGGYLMWGREHRPNPALQSKVPPAPVVALPASAVPSLPPAASAAASAPAIAVAPRPVEEIEDLLPHMPGELGEAWRELAPDWKLTVDAQDPCLVALAQQLHCYRAANLTLPVLRQLGRPGILTLKAGNGPAVYAQIIGLNEQTATLRVGQDLHSVRLVALARVWRGDFATFWRPPAGYTAELADGNRGEAIQTLASQLSRLDGTPARAGVAPQALDASLRARIQAFQRAHGLKPDGQPGPMTFMQLESATGEYEPRLKTELR
jgi:general secretion pathway protein A